MDPNPRPVMDIRPQRPAPPRPVQRTDFTAEQPAPVPAPAAPAPQPAMSVPAPTPEPTPPTTPEPQIEEHHEVQPTPEIFPAELPKHKTPKLAIFLAVLISGGLISLAVFGYMKSQDKAETAQKPTTTQTVTTSDVDDSVDATDEALQKLDDDTDYSATDLSDDSLGL